MSFGFGLGLPFSALRAVAEAAPPAFDPQSEFAVTDVGNFWKIGTSVLWQGTGRSVAADSNGDAIGVIETLRDPTGAAASAVGRALVQATTGNKPVYDTTDAIYPVVAKLNAGGLAITSNDIIGSNYPTINFTTGAWTMAARIRCVSGYIAFGGDLDPRAGFRIVEGDSRIEAAVLNDVNTYTIAGPTGWHSIVMKKAAGSGGQVNVYLNGLADPVMTFNGTASTYTDNRVLIYASGSGQFRAGFFINKEVSDVAGLSSWLES